MKIRKLFSGLLGEIKGDKVKIGSQKSCIKTTKLGRNEPCFCGSNVKYKNCCRK
ncbi:SEC-C metal-binding domain-containing protein [Pseudoalteromonas sp. JSTW]|uniref:SEC-C metal-binding domain-containing protein n=1 Tax=Pseudoalteromonas sp. JSTW TaxID=2752475 RepID=UPI0015D53CCD|nr:SEC-C metal-binding domain-containing protein [Pseudoalteromonas sp. JSTW]QLJ10135.1 SEC-C domain-containing protein [Pseudoalteromonas sp. JSTW]